MTGKIVLRTVNNIIQIHIPGLLLERPLYSFQLFVRIDLKWVLFRDIVVCLLNY